MKKPIDPNLGNLGDDDFFIDVGDRKRDEPFTLNENPRPKAAEPKFKVTFNNESGEPAAEEAAESAVSADGEAVEERRALFSSEHIDSSSVTGKTAQHHHHHHSSGSSSHHHHSSGSSSSRHHSSSSSSSRHSSSSSSSRHSSSSSHHHSSSSKKKKLPLPARIAIAVLIVLLLIVVVAAATFLILRAAGHKDVMPVVTEDTQYQETIEWNGHTYRYNEDIATFAFLGVDQRELETVDETDFVGAADADIVAAVDTNSGTTRVIAIPRDTMVDIGIYSEGGVFLRTQKAQLCLAYSYGDGAEKSCQNTIDAMSRILYNVPIQKYFALDLDGIKPLNDAIGGVTVESLYDFTKVGYDVNVGDTVTLKGDMAEIYVRTRDMDNINASLNRTDRQIQYVKAYSQQFVPAVMRNFSTISNLYEISKDYSRTNLTLSNATYLGSLLLSKGVTSFDSYTLQGEMKASKDPVLPDVVHAEFYPDEDDLMQTVLDVFYIQID